MANICLQFGQCGNKLGATLFEGLFQDLPSDLSSNYWFNADPDGKLVANSLFVDQEHASVNHLLAKPAGVGWCYSADYAVLGGPCNNWADGYYALGPSLYETIYDRLRLLCESFDQVCGFMSIAGLYGGTGSSLMSYVTRLLRDNFSRKILCNVAVLPHHQEHSSIHNYNAIFALSKMYDDLDGLILCSNEDPGINCFQASPSDFSATNHVLADRLSCILQCDLNQNMFRRLPLLALHHDLKFLNVLSSPIFYAKTPISKIPWKSLLNNVESIVRCPGGASQKKILSLSETHGQLKKWVSLLIALRDNTTANVVPDFEQRFRNEQLYPPWSSRSDRLQVFKRSGSFSGKDKFWAVAVNNMHYSPFFENLVEKSWKTFNARAFVHQFCSEGVTEGDFVEVFLTLEQILDSYKQVDVVDF